MPFTLNAPVHSEQTLKKSRFIGCVEPVADRVAALARVAQRRAEHPRVLGAHGRRAFGCQRRR
jgi:putative IMPACT (imprinted ancient) family translation regulator